MKSQNILKPLILIICCALLSQAAFAQTPRETFTLCPNNDPNYTNAAGWTGTYTSERFVIRYNPNQSHDAFVTESAAQTALATLERTYDTLVTKYGYVTPYHAAATTKCKSEVIVTRGAGNSSGVTAWADGGGTAYGGLTGSYNNGGANSTERPIQWMPKSLHGATISHEWGHGLQQISGGMRDSEMVGWFHECHTQWMVNQVHGGTSGGLDASRVVMRQAHLHPGYGPSRYENWPFLEYLWHENGGGSSSPAEVQKGWDVVNNIWTKSPGRSSNQRYEADPFEWIQKGNPNVYPDWASLGDFFGRFAMKSVIYDFGPKKATFRSNYNASGVSEVERARRYTYLQSLDTNDMTAANNRYVSPHGYAPQRFAFNIIRLYPNESASNITVKFRGDVQTKNNRQNYAPQSGYEFEPPASRVHDDPGSDWRYGLVAVQGQAGSTSANVTARYSDLTRAVNGGQLTQPDVAIDIRGGDTEFYLVVTAAPTVNHKLEWDQYHYTTYRFPYMVEITGAKPEGFQPVTTETRVHSNGGGQVAANLTVPATVYVGPHAKILGGSVSGNARIEGRAVVRGGTVRGSAVIKDNAIVRNGTVEGDAVVSDGAIVWGATVNQNAKVYGSTYLTGGTITGSAEVGGAAVFANGTLSGTAKALGDAYAGDLTKSAGVWYTRSGNAHNDPKGAERTTVPVEFTKMLSREWYGESATPVVRVAAAGRAKGGAEVRVRGKTLNVSSPDNGALTVKVIDMRGKVMSRFAANGSGNFSLTNIPAGRYFVDVRGAGVKQTLPIIVK